MAPHSSTLAWKTPWMEEPGRLQSMGSQRVGLDWETSLSLFPFMHWRRKWQPTPVFLPGKSQGWGEPGGLPSTGLHRVRHDWIDVAAAAAATIIKMWWRNWPSFSRTWIFIWNWPHKFKRQFWVSVQIVITYLIFNPQKEGYDRISLGPRDSSMGLRKPTMVPLPGQYHLEFLGGKNVLPAA